MSTLYELTAEYQVLLEMAEDPETDPQALADTMEAIGGEIEDKADGYAKVMQELAAEATKVTAEVDRLTARKKALTDNQKRMKETLQSAMVATGKKKFKTTLFSFGIQKNPASVVLDTDKIPEQYLIQQEPKVDKAGIKKDLQAGVKLDGIAHLEQTESLRIR